MSPTARPKRVYYRWPLPQMASVPCTKKGKIVPTGWRVDFELNQKCDLGTGQRMSASLIGSAMGGQEPTFHVAVQESAAGRGHGTVFTVKGSRP